LSQVGYDTGIVRPVQVEIVQLPYGRVVQIDVNNCVVVSGFEPGLARSEKKELIDHLVVPGFEDAREDQEAGLSGDKRGRDKVEHGPYLSRLIDDQW
jgi:hypothetical protein